MKQSREPPSRTRVGLTLRLDSLLGLDRASVAVEVLDAKRDVAVAGAQLVAAAVVVERQLELLLPARRTAKK